MKTFRLVVLLVLAAAPVQGLECGGPNQRGEDLGLELVSVVIDGVPSEDRQLYEGTHFGIWNQVDQYSTDGYPQTVVFSGFRSVNSDQPNYLSREYLEYYPTYE